MAPMKRKSDPIEAIKPKKPLKRQRTTEKSGPSKSSDNATGDKSNDRPKKKAPSSHTEAARPEPISVLTNQQPAFPRGGAGPLTLIEKKQIQAQATRDALREHMKGEDLFADTKDAGEDFSDMENLEPTSDAKVKERRGRGKKLKHTKVAVEKESGPRVEGLSYKRIVPGSLILGQITAISSRDLTLALPNNLTGYVPLNAVSPQLTKKVESLLDSDKEDEDADNEETDIDLTHYFHIGQYLRAAVTSTGEEAGTAKGKRRIELGLDPRLVNVGLSRSNIVAGCTVQVTVTSIEDHGLDTDMGVLDSQLRGFIPKKELQLPSTMSSVKTGTVLLCLVTGNPKGRMVQLSASLDKLTAMDKPCVLSTAANIDAFLPGTAVEALLTDVARSGLLGKVMGMLDVTADLVHSGLASITDDEELPYKSGKKVRGRLVCTFPAAETKKLGFSLLPNVVGLTSDKSHSPDISISSVVRQATVIHVEPGLGVYLSMEGSLRRAFAHISRLSDKKVDSISETMGPYKVGSKHVVRVLDFNPVDELYLVSLQEKVIKQAFLRVEDVKVGEVVKGTIENILIGEKGVKGLILELSDGVSGLVPYSHLSDIALQHPEKKFREGLTVKARVLSTDIEKRQIRLTLKKTLVNSELTPWIDYKHIAVGDTCTGTLVKVDGPGAVVQFYGDVKAFLPVSEMSEAYIKDATLHFQQGQVITVHALSIDAESKRMTVSCKDPALASSPQVDFTTLIPGSLVSGTVFEKSQDDLSIRLEPSGAVGRLQLDQISDGSARKRQSALGKIRVGQTLQDLLILNVHVNRKTVTLCNRSSLKKATEDGNLLTSYEVLKEGKVVTGLVSNITSDGVFVNFAAGISGLVTKKQVPVEAGDQPEFGMTRLQPVTGRVTSVDYKGAVPRFWLTMREGQRKETDSVSVSDESAVQNALIDPVDGVSKTVGDFSMGKITKARVIAVKDSQLNVELAQGIQGRIDVSEMFDSWADIPDRKRPLSNCKTKQILDVKIIGAHDTRNHRFLPLTHRSGKQLVLELTAKPSLLNDAAIEPLSLESLKVGSPLIAYVNNIAEGHLWVNVTPSVRGRIRAIDIANDLSLLTDLEKNFPIGSALKVHVTGVDVDKNRLDLSARGSNSETPVTMADITTGMIMPGRITKVTERQILIQLNDHVIGAVELMDMADDYSLAYPLRYQKNEVIRVCVVHMDVPNKKINLSLRPSRVLSSTLTVKDPEVTSAQQLNVNDVRRGFITNVAEKGLFVALGHGVTAFIRVTNLSDQYLKEWKDHFQRDQLVEGRVISVDKDTGHVQMSLKASVLKEDYVAPTTYHDLRVGDIVTGKVAAVKDFGVFIVVDNSLNVRGLCHRSEIAEKRIEDASKLFNEGDAVKAKVLKIDLEKTRISFGLKASYFADTEEDEMESASDEEAEEEGVLIAGGSEGEDDLDDEDDLADDGSDDEDSDPGLGAALDNEKDAPESSPEPTVPIPNLTTRSIAEGLSVGGFDWAGGLTNGSSKRVLSDTEDESTAQKPKKKRRAEIQVDRTGDLDAHGPQSVDDYERLLLGQPDSSLLWLQYMAFRIELGEVDQARQIGERAIRTIGLGQEGEKVNVWIALLNLENTYGDDESMEATFKRACEYNDPQEIHERVTSIYIQSAKLDKAADLFQTMVKKFAQDPKIWINYATFLFETAEDPEKARQLLPRALLTLPPFAHVDITSKFAQLEFRTKTGLPERGRTIFEGLLDSSPKRVDLWNVLIDLETHLGNKDQIRQLFERIVAGKVKSKQAKFFFKRWLAFEGKEGDERSADAVKARAAEWAKAHGKNG